MISSPGPIPSWCSVSSMAAVAEFKHTARLVWQKDATWRSSSLVLGPVVIQPERRVSATCAISASPISGGENGIFITILPSLCCLLCKHHTHNLPSGLFQTDDLRVHLRDERNAAALHQQHRVRPSGLLHRGRVGQHRRAGNVAHPIAALLFKAVQQLLHLFV